MLKPRYVDSREPEHRKFALEKAGFEVKALASGDVQFPEAGGGVVLIELKSVNQLLQDMASGVLVSQCRRLLASCDFPILLIWGHWAQHQGKLLNTNYTWTQAWNQLQTLQNWGIRLRLATSDEQATSEIMSLAEYYAKSMHPSFIRRASGNVRIAALSLVRGIDEYKAKKLLETFSTLEGIVSASVEDYQKVDGIGPKLAQRLKEFFEDKSNAW